MQTYGVSRGTVYAIYHSHVYTTLPIAFAARLEDDVTVRVCVRVR